MSVAVTSKSWYARRVHKKAAGQTLIHSQKTKRGLANVPRSVSVIECWFKSNANRRQPSKERDKNKPRRKLETEGEKRIIRERLRLGSKTAG